MQYIHSIRPRSRGADRSRIDLSPALREAGKALSVDPIIVDRVAKVHHWFDSKADLLAHFAEAGLDVEAPMNQQWATFATAWLRERVARPTRTGLLPGRAAQQPADGLLHAI